MLLRQRRLLGSNVAFGGSKMSRPFMTASRYVETVGARVLGV